MSEETLQLLVCAWRERGREGGRDIEVMSMCIERGGYV